MPDPPNSPVPRMAPTSSQIDELLRENASLRARIDFLNRENARLQHLAGETHDPVMEAQLLEHPRCERSAGNSHAIELSPARTPPDYEPTQYCHRKAPRPDV